MSFKNAREIYLKLIIIIAIDFAALQITALLIKIPMFYTVISNLLITFFSIFSCQKIFQKLFFRYWP